MHKFSTILIVSNITTAWDILKFYTQNPVSRISQLVNYNEADNDDYGHNDDDENNDDDNDEAYMYICYFSSTSTDKTLDWIEATKIVGAQRSIKWPNQDSTKEGQACWEKTTYKRGQKPNEILYLW